MTVVTRALCLAPMVALLAPTAAEAAFDAVLQGRSAGSTTWIDNNVRGWRELDLVPTRVYMTGGPISNQAIRVEIERLDGSAPGIEDLSRFSASSNVTITAGPVINAPAGGRIWSYSFTLNVRDANPAYLEFRTRLAVGSLLNPGSSLHLYGVPSLGTLQIHKVSEAGTVDLSVSKSGPAVVRPGEVITYTLVYSNKASASGAAGNVQLTDALPAGAVYVTNSATKTPVVSGNMLTWNLGIIDPGTNGQISFQARVSDSVTNRQVLQNVAGIDTDQNDTNVSNNTARLATTVSFNSAPVARDDAYTVLEDSTLTIPAPGVLSNDSDSDGNGLTAVLVDQPAHGQVAFLSNGSFIYTPHLNYFGADHFTYAARDGVTSSVPARVNITVNAVNDAPVARGDAYEAIEDVVLAIPAPGLLANDEDIDGGTLTPSVVTSPSHGTVSVNANGSFSYAPAPDFFGTDTFTYRLSDGSANSQPVTVTIRIAPVNDAPRFVGGGNRMVSRNSGAQAGTRWATAIAPGPANESGQTLQFMVSIDRPALFTVAPAITPDGMLSFTPAEDAYGSLTVTVILKDNGGVANGGVDVSAAHTFTIQINAPPTATLVIPTNGTVFLAPANIPIMATAEDADGSVSKVELMESGTNILSQLLQAPYMMVWSNVAVGTYHLIARATDELGATGVSEPVAVQVVDGPPVAKGTLRFNPQTGLFEQPVRVTNPSSFDMAAVCIFVSNVPQYCRVWNAAGITNGLPFVQYNMPVAAGKSADMIIEFYDPLRVMPEPELFAEAVAQMPPIQPVGAETRLVRQRWLSDGTFLIEFNTLSNRSYYIQYCDEMPVWKTALPAIRGTGTRTQWIDNGAPRTETAPSRTKSRLYRVVVTP